MSGDGVNAAGGRGSGVGSAPWPRRRPRRRRSRAGRSRPRRAAPVDDASSEQAHHGPDLHGSERIASRRGIAPRAPQSPAPAEVRSPRFSCKRRPSSHAPDPLSHPAAPHAAQAVVGARGRGRDCGRLRGARPAPAAIARRGASGGGRRGRRGGAAFKSGGRVATRRRTSPSTRTASCSASSLVVGWYLTLPLAERDGLPKETMANCYVVTALAALAGSRILYVVTNLDEFKSVGRSSSPSATAGSSPTAGSSAGSLGSWAFLAPKRIRLLPGPTTRCRASPRV